MSIHCATCAANLTNPLHTSLLNFKYKRHHEKICIYLHWCILQDHDVLVSNTWHTNDPQPATKISDHITLHYDMTLEVDYGVGANHPGIVIWDLARKGTSFIDVTVPMDINMVKAAAGKYKKYQDLEIAYKKEFQL
eukprot:15340295-Ditylum_brightwellii.AAC.1